MIPVRPPTRLPPIVREPLSRGRWANAIIWLEHWPDGIRVVKDFSERIGPVRTMLGVLLVRRELMALHRCAGIVGVPCDVHRRGPYALTYRFCPGRTLREVEPEALDPAFFPALEDLVRAIHARGIVHNDLRNARNLIVGVDGRPHIIDFQSHINTRRLPSDVRRHLEAFDLSGVYKHWSRLRPDSLDASRRAALARVNRWRHWWIMRGYLGVGRSHSTTTPSPPGSP
jgi:RIO-like serine/threonine protein kinase